MEYLVREKICRTRSVRKCTAYLRTNMVGIPNQTEIGNHYVVTALRLQVSRLLSTASLLNLSPLKTASVTVQTDDRGTFEITASHSSQTEKICFCHCEIVNVDSSSSSGTTTQAVEKIATVTTAVRTAAAATATTVATTAVATPCRSTVVWS